MILGVALLALTFGAPVLAQDVDGGGSSIIWVVRHAERADAGMDDQPDPELSQIGHARASELARFLGEAGITAVYSTPFRRTMQTAMPLAQSLGLEIETYDPRDAAAMEVFHARLRAPGRHLVVGHSNTTPALVEQLGGDPISAIAVEEYDRIYVVHLTPDGRVESTLLRFGAPARGG
jgi:broad specificity phosphatase PhoE